MAAKVIWAPDSLTDIREIASDNVSAAMHLGARLIDAAERLREFPQLGPVLCSVRRSDLRELIVTDYRITYRFDASSQIVTILRVWRGARGNPPL